MHNVCVSFIRLLSFIYSFIPLAGTGLQVCCSAGTVVGRNERCVWLDTKGAVCIYVSMYSVLGIIKIIC